MRRREAIEGILYTSPWIVGFIVFIAGPLIASLYLSFTKYNVLRPAKFIGLQNYIVALTKDDLFLPVHRAHFLLRCTACPPFVDRFAGRGYFTQPETGGNDCLAHHVFPADVDAPDRCRAALALDVES